MSSTIGPIRIDNQIVTTFNGTGISIQPIRMYQRHNPNILVEYLPYVYTGSRRTDALLLQRILSGTELIENHNIINYNNGYILK